MQFYLSSIGLGRETHKLKEMLPENRLTAYIPNAIDYSSDISRRNKSNGQDMDDLRSVGLDPEILDLRDYFGKKDNLESALENFGVIWVRGGNVFVLRQAMRLSGFDAIIKKLKKRAILYGGYSAGVCVLSPTLHGLDLMDDVSQKPYGDDIETVWEGLGLIDFSVIPHYPSNPLETDSAKPIIQYFVDNGITFRTMRDGDVIIIE
ncbi:MAG: Type 1 glutamine amidotransferase-like domain-containing protein [Thermoplasmataceae archaeon]|jgi:dipeptidase E